MRGPLHPTLTLCLTPRLTFRKAMTAAQTRLADTIDMFYGAGDKTSEGAMAAHAYKRAVDDLDTGIGRELVSSIPLLRHLRVYSPRATRLDLISLAPCLLDIPLGCTLPNDGHGTTRENECVFPRCE